MEMNVSDRQELIVEAIDIVRDNHSIEECALLMQGLIKELTIRLEYDKQLIEEQNG